MEISFESVGISNGFCEASGGIWCFFQTAFPDQAWNFKGDLMNFNNIRLGNQRAPIPT